MDLCNNYFQNSYYVQDITLVVGEAVISKITKTSHRPCS